MAISSSKTPGDLDPDFGDSGHAQIPDHLKAIHPQLLDDQKILSVATQDFSNVATLVRHLPTGAIDTSYGNQGTVQITLPIGPELGKTRLRMLPDGSCLVAGPVGTLQQSSGFVFSLLANGELDTGFGESGFSILDAGTSTAVTSLDATRDGKAMVTLGVFHGTAYEVYLARLDNGHLDHSYGPDGSGMVYVGNAPATDLLVLPNDGVLLTTETLDLTKAVFRQYLPDGSPDPAFGDQGVFELPMGEGGRLEVRAFLRQPDGKIVAVGSADVGFGVHFLITRLNADASLDSTFNNGEPKMIALQGYEAYAHHVALQPDNKLIAVGSTLHRAVPIDNLVLMRFLPDAGLDTSFGIDGQVMTDLGAVDQAELVVVQSDGNILVAASTNNLNDGTHKAQLMRYLG